MKRICNSIRLAYFDELAREDDEKFESNRYLIEIVQPFQYTPENIHKLKRLFDEGLIDSYPIIQKGEKSVTYKWINANGDIHREGGLPAFISPNEWYWYINGACSRLNGPAAIRYNDNGVEIYWYKNGRIIAVSKMINGHDSFTIAPNQATGRQATASRSDYDDVVKTNFPNAKRLYARDWTDFMYDADATMIKNAYFDTLPDLPRIEWVIMEPKAFGADLPLGKIATASYEVSEVMEACIKFFNAENWHFSYNDMEVKPYEEEGRHFVNFIKKRKDLHQAMQIEFYCGEIRASHEAV